KIAFMSTKLLHRYFNSHGRVSFPFPEAPVSRCRWSCILSLTKIVCLPIGVLYGFKGWARRGEPEAGSATTEKRCRAASSPRGCLTRRQEGLPATAPKCRQECRRPVKAG